MQTNYVVRIFNKFLTANGELIFVLYCIINMNILDDNMPEATPKVPEPILDSFRIMEMVSEYNVFPQFYIEQYRTHFYFWKKWKRFSSLDAGIPSYKTYVDEKEAIKAINYYKHWAEK